MDQEKKNLRILYWNVRSFQQRRLDIEKKLCELDILVCVETWLKPDFDVQFSGFLTVRKDRIASRGGGIIFLIRKSLAYIEIDNLESPCVSVELCGIHINNVNPSFDLIACYRSPGLVLKQTDWNTIINNIKHSRRCLLVGDFNAHNKNWNCRTTDSNGLKLENSLNTHNNAFIHNTNSFSHIDTYRNFKSNIDLVISSINLSDKINCNVIDETWGSDHYPIFVNVEVIKHMYTKKSFKIKSVRTDWSSFKQKLDDQFESFLYDDYESCIPAEKYNFLMGIVTEAIKDSSPKKIASNKCYKHSNPVPWWDAECDKLKRLRRAAWKKWRYGNHLEDLIMYKKYAALAKRTFKTKKKECFRKFSETINFHSSPSYVWNKCKIFKNKWVKINPSHDSQNLQPSINTDLSSERFDPPFIPNCQNNEFLENHFTFVEFNIALNAKKNVNSSPGMDGIDFEILSELPIKFKLLLLDIFNQMYENNSFPTEWKKSYVHFIPKGNGTKFRPISLTSCACKLFESMVKNRMQWWAEVNNLIPSSQHGFRKGHSCADNLSNLSLKVQEAFMEKKQVLAAFIDVRGAFPNVQIQKLLNMLASKGFPARLLLFINFIMYEREAFTAARDDEPQLMYKGVPQGGVLSPLLYILYVSDIVENLPKNIIVSQFADDIALYIKFSSVKRAKSILQNAITRIQNNLCQLGLELEPEKTVLIHFNNKNIVPGNVVIQIGSHTIKSSEYTRFLGVFFDYKLAFYRHVTEIHKRCFRALNIIRFLCGTWWGADPTTLITLYKSYVRSITDYASFVYFPVRKTQIEKIEKIQYNAIRSAVGFRVSTPKNILLAEAKLPFLKARSSHLCKNFLTKTFSNLESQTLKSIKSFYNISMKRDAKANKILGSSLIDIYTLAEKVIKQPKHLIYCHDFETLLTAVPADTSFGRNIVNSINPNEILNDLIVKNNALAVYTDGSKTSSGVGYACISPQINVAINKKILCSASVYTAECIALNEALTLALNNQNRNICIFSDSLSAITSLQNIKFNIKVNPFILQIKEKLRKFYKNNPYHTALQIYWIPAHMGIYGNEKADQLAKEATNFDLVDIKLCPFTDFYEKFKSDCKLQTNEILISQSNLTGKIYFETYFQNRKSPWFAGKNLNRNFISTFSRIRANHYNLAASLARIKIVSSPTCQCGMADEDINHVLWQCSLYDIQRSKLIKGLRKLNHLLPLNIESIVSKPQITVCLAIFSFIKACGLKI